MKITPDSVLSAEKQKFKCFVIKLLENVDVESCEGGSDTDWAEEAVVEEIQHTEKLEVEKTKLKLDIMVNELGVERLKNLILYLKSRNVRKLKKMRRLSANKAYLQKRLQKFRLKRELSED